MILGREEHLAASVAAERQAEGLTLRDAFERDLERSLAHARTTDLQVALLFLDLDDFDDMNGTFGHPAGDGLLEAVGRRLAWVTGTDGRACRIDGDEFILLHVGVFGRIEPIAFAERVLRTVRRPFDLAELSPEAAALAGQKVTCSIGIAVGNVDSTGHGLLAQAEIAMYAAKDKRERQPTAHGHYEVFHAVLESRIPPGGKGAPAPE